MSPDCPASQASGLEASRLFRYRLCVTDTTPMLHVRPDGNWLQLLRPAPAAPVAAGPRPALFLDRDGCIVEEADYLCRVEDLHVIPGAAAVIAAANAAGWPVVVVTNQSGIGRGYFGWPEFAEVQAALVERLAAAGAALDMVLACPFHADGRPPWAVADHPWRKPRPGMLLAAAEILAIDLARSFMVGDAARDMHAARAAGLPAAAHVATGHGRAERPAALAAAAPGFRVEAWDSLSDGLSIFR